tara:strand:+ start:256 stop:393 length:138 start_codon:yes stop_codon:yes gene_type:complete
MTIKINEKEKRLIKYSLEDFYHENIKKGNNKEYKNMMKDLMYLFK